MNARSKTAPEVVAINPQPYGITQADLQKLESLQTETRAVFERHASFREEIENRLAAGARVEPGKLRLQLDPGREVVSKP